MREAWKAQATRRGRPRFGKRLWLRYHTSNAARKAIWRRTALNGNFRSSDACGEHTGRRRGVKSCPEGARFENIRKMFRGPYQDLIWGLLRRFCANYTLILRIDGAGFAPEFDWRFTRKKSDCVGFTQGSVKDSPTKSFAAQVLRRLYADFAYRRRRACAKIRLKAHPQEI
jgi:hypothetical protein